MHNIQQQRQLQVGLQKYTMENEFYYTKLLKRWFKNSILMLDEFVLPDIASANIIKILFTFYFKLEVYWLQRQINYQKNYIQLISVSVNSKILEY